MKAFVMLNMWNVQQKHSNNEISINRLSFSRSPSTVIGTIFTRSHFHQMISNALAVNDLHTWYAPRRYFVISECSLERVA